MGDYFKELVRHEDNFYIFAALVAILIFLIVIYIISKIKYPENENSSYIGAHNKSGRTKIKSNEYYEPKADPQPLVRERKELLNNQFANPRKLPNKRNGVTDEESDLIIQSSDGWKEFVEENNEKRNHIQQKLNDDGSVRTEIDFDSTNDNLAPDPFLPKYEYLETANNGQFRKLLPSDEKSFFRTWVENGIRMFEFHGNVEKALANINAVFDDVCEIEGKQNGATQILNINPGTLTSQLKVDKPAKIKLT